MPDNAEERIVRQMTAAFFLREFSLKEDSELTAAIRALATEGRGE